MQNNQLSPFEFSYLTQILSIADTTVLLAVDSNNLVTQVIHDLQYEISELKVLLENPETMDVKQVRLSIRVILDMMADSFKTI